MKRFICLALALTLCLALCACTPKLSGPVETVVLRNDSGCSFSYPTDTWTLTGTGGMTTLEAKDGSAELRVRFLDSEEELEKQVETYESLADWESFSRKTMTLAGCKATRYTYYDEWSGNACIYVLPFPEDAPGGFAGIQFVCKSDVSMDVALDDTVAAIANSLVIEK